MNIAAILHDQAIARGASAAIVERHRTVTFEQLDRAATAAAEDMAAAGLRPGMRALVFVPMSIALYATLIGMFRLRVTAVFVDPSAGRDRLAQCIARTAPDAFVAIPRAHLLRLSTSGIRRLPHKIAVRGHVPFTPTIGTRLARDAAPVDPCSADTPAIITFTSGSTGEPKAALRTHGFLVAQHQALLESLNLRPGDVDLTTLPIFLLANLASGVTSVIPDADLRAPGTIEPDPVRAQIASSRVTRTVASPAFLLRLAEQPSAGTTLGAMRHIYTGGAPVFPPALDALAAASPLADVVAVYGSTEAEPIAKIERRQISDADRRAMQGGAGLIAGTPVAAVDLAIVEDRWSAPLGPWTKEDLAREKLTPNTAGEIIVAGSHVLAGYLDGRGNDETKIRVGERIWHRTGDAGYVDDLGRLWLLGRCSAKVDDEDGRVYPFAVECAASGVEGLRRCAFLRHRGKRVLVVELEEGARRNGVVKDLGERLGWAQLADVLVVPRIPVDARHNAKVNYAKLESLIADR